MTARARRVDEGDLPDTEVDLPDIELPITDAFSSLEDDLPLLLLPVRIETRYRRNADPPQLRIRIFPDQIHIDSDRPGASAGELEVTTEFWRAWHRTDSETDRVRAWRTLVARVGQARAGHLARLLRPRTGGRGELVFPGVGGVPDRSPAAPVLLPERWLAVGYSQTGVLFEHSSLPVVAGLRTSADPRAAPSRIPGSGLAIDDAMAWMFDYDRAVADGMAITVPLTGDAAAALDEIATLLVVGVSAITDPDDAAQALDRLLAAHARTDGLAFVPQGTPTNNTESVIAGEPLAQERPEGLYHPDPIGSTTQAGQFPAESAAMRRELDPVIFSSDGNASQLTLALGLPDTGTLSRLPYATDAERPRSRAMVQVTFEAVLGTFVRGLLRVGDTAALDDAAIEALRDWCVTHVTGGAPYACLRVGSQPYGILPVRRATSSTNPAGTAEQVQSIVSLLIAQWRRAVSGVPRLDPNRGAGAETDIATVLATQAHPARFFTRRLDQYSDLTVFEQMTTPQWWYQHMILDVLEGRTGAELETPHLEIASIYGSVSTNVAPEDIDGQIFVWDEVRRFLPAFLPGQPADVVDDGLGYVDIILAMLHGYQARQNPVRELDLRAYAGSLGQQNTQLIEGILYSASVEWGDVGLVEAPGAPAGHTAADYLADLRTRFAAGADAWPASSLDSSFLASQPLLYQVLDRTLPQVGDDAVYRSAVRGALDTLAGRSAEELEWLMRESLGLGGHRLDAWATSLASERLSRLRVARPGGVQVGAYGWVTGLRPRDADAESAGFVHAPSMAHATTAALLRAGWLTHGSDDPLSPAAVNYTSARVRAASWLLDGVRQGQRLGDLLGYRFERALHDRGADEQIRPVRERVLAAGDSPDLPPDEPVDGIALLELHRAGGLSDVPRPVTAALAEIEDAFDATNDASLVEAVHQLAAGNSERATAVLGALAGTHSPPELHAARTPRPGVSVEHRVLVLLDPAAGGERRGWVRGVRDTVAPALEAWVAGLLPPPGSVGFTRWSDGGAETPGTVADLRLSALDALYLIGDDPAVVSDPLRTLAGAERIDPQRRGAAPVALAEFAVLGIELRRAFESLRVADARDLRPGHEAGEPQLDDSDALAAVDALVAEFRSLVGTGTAGIAEAARQLALFGLAAPDPARLAATVARRLANVLAVEVDPADPRPGRRRQLATLLGGAVPLLGRFPVAAELSGQQPVATPVEVDEWLDLAGLVRPSVARLTGAGMLSELLDPSGGLRAAARQLPAYPGAGWAATGPVPAGTGGRLSIVTIGAAPAGEACGLVVDAWSERIPGTTQDTGLALQFDAPSNRPPQGWLLAVTPDGERWSRQLVLDTLTETLEWATLRAVGTEDLLDFGRAIPTVHVPGGVIDWPAGDPT